MEIRILQLLEGARQARGLTVIIDVLRAFSLECYLAHRGAAELRPVASLEEAFAWRKRDPEALLVGERGGAKCPGFDFGNSPSGIPAQAVRGRRVIHTTSAGTQGLTGARGAGELLSGSLVNARAVAAYIRQRQPGTVSLVAMGNAGVREAPEDLLCAQYIRSLLLQEPIPDLNARIRALQFHGGDHFFNPATQQIYPEPDFWLCTKRDLFPFVLRARRDELGLYMERVDVL
ncbi:MAG: 2-phosphosulfolactate phosphatase [Oscillospiraceae bacterium]|nr:2-phosphosulfolactate phosphatase [Oscillospiraceae bacterium]